MKFILTFLHCDCTPRLTTSINCVVNLDAYGSSNVETLLFLVDSITWFNSSLFFLYNYLQPKQIQKLNEEKIEIIERINDKDNEGKAENLDKVNIIEMIENESKHSTAVKIQLNKGLSYICVDTNDLEIIKQILIINGKRFRILEF